MDKKRRRFIHSFRYSQELKVFYILMCLFTTTEPQTVKYDQKFDQQFQKQHCVRKVFRHLGIWGIDDEQSKTTFYNWFVKNAFRLMKGSFMLGISRKEKLVLLREMVQDDFFNDALRKVDKSYYSKLDRIEIFLFKHKLVVLLYLFNTMIFNRYAAKPLIERNEEKKCIKTELDKLHTMGPSKEKKASLVRIIAALTSVSCADCLPYICPLFIKCFCLVRIYRISRNKCRYRYELYQTGQSIFTRLPGLY